MGTFVATYASSHSDYNVHKQYIILMQQQSIAIVKLLDWVNGWALISCRHHWRSYSLNIQEVNDREISRHE